VSLSLDAQKLNKALVLALQSVHSLAKPLVATLVQPSSVLEQALFSVVLSAIRKSKTKKRPR
jgi:uncharacterized membrane protein YvlD (DUF360 family)